MSKPLTHAKSSARKYGGTWADYIAVHSLMDSSKAHIADNRHRCIFHSSFGIFIVEQIFGTSLQNSDGKDVSVRAIAEDHVIEDLGVIPTVQDYLVNMQLTDWMAGKATVESCPASCQEIMTERQNKRNSRYLD
jgi:hypothetical protein